MSEHTTSDQASTPPQKPYVKPRLVEYGPVEKLTHSGSANLGDAGPMMMTCL